MAGAMKKVPPFNIRPVSREWRVREGEAAKRPAYRTAWANSCYQRRADGHDDIGSFHFSDRAGDLVASGVIAPEDGAVPDIESLWRAADAAAVETGDPTAIAAWAVVADLPSELPIAQQLETIERFGRRHFASAGMVAEYAVHAARPRRDGTMGQDHVHWLVTARCWAESERKGAVNKFWLPGQIWRSLGRDWQAMTAGAMAASRIAYAPPCNPFELPRRGRRFLQAMAA